MNDKIWEIKNKEVKNEDILKILLASRGIKTKRETKEFFSPRHPDKFSLDEVKIDQKQIKKSAKRIFDAIDKKEKIVVYGDYDADGICATAILWEALHKLKAFVMPFIPNRFEDGYGLKKISLDKLKNIYPDLGLVITVDNGVVAYEALNHAKSIGLDVIITDHHTKEKKKLPSFATIHSTKVCGSVVAWLLAKELLGWSPSLELAVIGTIADQMSLVGINRSIVKHGLVDLNKTKRMGLLKMFSEAKIDKKVGTYEIGFLIAPRINAMGRLGEGIDSLRLLCTKDELKANNLAQLVAKTNIKRQKVVDLVLKEAVEQTIKINNKGIVCISSASFHEGIIGLAAGKLVEKFNRPAIVISEGETFSKGSARSIPGINITDLLRQMSDLLFEVGGHELASGFSIENKKLKNFKKRLESISIPLMNSDLLTRSLDIDIQITLDVINWELQSSLSEFEPFGLGNPAPLFASFAVDVLEKKQIGAEKKHLKFKLKQNNKIIDAIGFNFGEFDRKIGDKIDIVYSIEENIWNGSKSIQLKIKDLK